MSRGHRAASGRVHRDLGDADHEGVGAERVVEQLRGLVLELDRGAFGTAVEPSVLSGSSVRPSRKNSGALSAATAPSTLTLPVGSDAPGSTTKSVSSTVLPPPVRLSPLRRGRSRPG